MSVRKYLDQAGLATLVEEIKKRMSSIYRVQGSARYINESAVDGTFTETGLWQQVEGAWTHITEVQAGWVYNIANDFTTDDDFIEGAGDEIKAGTNIVAVNLGTDDIPEMKWDVLAIGFSLEGYQLINLENPISIEWDYEGASLPSTTEESGASDIATGSIAHNTSDNKVYQATVTGTSISWSEVGDTVTVEGAIHTLTYIQPTPIPDEEIIDLFED